MRHHHRWGASRRSGPVGNAFAAIVLFFAALSAGLERTLYAIDFARIERFAIVGAVSLAALALIAWLWRENKRAREEEAAHQATSPQADVVALRFAFEAPAAAKILRDLGGARGSDADRLRAVTSRLVEAQLDYRLVGLETTKPLPETAAAELFFSWSDGARGRYPKPATPESAGLVVVCLHVETTEEIPDLPESDPKSVVTTLEMLRDQPRTVRRVDLWASRHALSEAALREADPKLVAARA
ncbi:MAG: hypothetical protein K1X94_14905 [Sandaracinaceae bacterium]|nr:hypothetical protein [Sandaracinaceae bacterium]